MKKKIAIFYSEGGGGHRTVAQSLEEILSKEYEVIKILPLATILKSLDPIRVLTRNRFSGETLYNFFLKRRWFFLITLYGYFGEWISVLKYKKIVARTKKFLIENQCDFLISNFPYFNNGFLAAAREVGIPFFVVVCDLYTKHYLHGISSPKYPLFRHSVFFKHPLPLGSCHGFGLTDSQIVPIGLPVRREFTEEKDRNAILSEWEIPQGVPIILIIMGYLGSQSSIEYFRRLREQLHTRAHIVVILGRDSKIHAHFEEAAKKTPQKVSYTCVTFTDKVSDLFYVSDIVITKSGGLSVSEAFYMKKPVILDWTKNPLIWEKMSGDFVKEAKIGYNARSYSAGVSKVQSWLMSPEKLGHIRENYQIIPNIDFRKAIKQHVSEMLEISVEKQEQK